MAAEKVELGNTLATKLRKPPSGDTLIPDAEWFKITRYDEQEEQPDAYISIHEVSSHRWFVTWTRGQRNGSFFVSGDRKAVIQEGMKKVYSDGIWRTGPVFI